MKEKDDPLAEVRKALMQFARIGAAFKPLIISGLEKMYKEYPGLAYPAPWENFPNGPSGPPLDITPLCLQPKQHDTAALPPDTQAVAPMQPPTAGKKRQHVTQAQAARYCGVSASTIRNWEKDLRRPPNYPGREDTAALAVWGQGYQQSKRLAKGARQANRATPTDPHTLDRHHTRTAFNDTEEE